MCKVGKVSRLFYFSIYISLSISAAGRERHISLWIKLHRDTEDFMPCAMFEATLFSQLFTSAILNMFYSGEPHGFLRSLHHFSSYEKCHSIRSHRNALKRASVFSR